jgi:hypothetical protein
MEQAKLFLETCARLGWTPTVRGSVISIAKAFNPGDTQAFVDCDAMAYDILDMAPLKGGSIWGTDGGSVGGYVAVKNGQYVLNKSGNGKRFISALQKILTADTVKFS